MATAKLQTPATWRQMSSADRKRAIEDRIEISIRRIAAQQRQPNDWERFQIGSALSGAYSGWHWLAYCSAQLADEPDHSISPELLKVMNPELAHLDLGQMIRSLAAVRASPVTEYGNLVPAESDD